MEAVIVALIGLVGVVLASIMQRNRKAEKNEHGAVMQTLGRVESKIDGHINDHAQVSLVPKKRSSKSQ